VSAGLTLDENCNIALHIPPQSRAEPISDASCAIGLVDEVLVAKVIGSPM
jgi:hypothetical protein